MGINVFQVGVFNNQMIGSGSLQAGSYASEFPLAFDNINASGSRLAKIMGTYGSVDNQDIFSGQTNDSWGQPTGQNNNNNTAAPSRPNGGYFVRGLWFSNTAFAPSGNRNGYVGSFVSGACLQGGQYATSFDYAHDLNAGPVGGVDYEPIYSHGTINPPTQANLETQWRDGSNPPSDGADLVQNDSSAYTRTAYEPPSTFLINIDSAGAQQIGSGLVTFHVENRPSLRAAGFSDGNPQLGAGGQSNTGSTTVQDAPGPYGTDPTRDQDNPLVNPYEYYQASGTRPLNSRGLSLHLAKVMDNWYGAYGYVYEEDGVTLAPNNHPGGAGHPIDISVNAQNEYLWQRDQACAIVSISNNGTVASLVTTPNTFTVGQIVYITGLTTNPNYAMNGQFFTVSATGLSSTTFQVNFTHAAYGTTAENPYGYAVFAPDMRVRQTAKFNINEEYYGMVMDTKCTIWSNKASMIPLLFVDLALNWTSSVHKRIAGVAVVPTYIGTTGVLGYQIFFLSEDGYLARYDFTQTNGVLELAGTGSFAFAANAPAPLAGGEAYGAMQARSTTAPITATAVTTNTTLTVTCANTFEVGDYVNLTGTQESFLNNTTVQVATLIGVAPNYTGFTATIPTQSNYVNASDTGSAVGWSIWALYGTMTPDPRTTQSALTHTANINFYRYTLGLGSWSSIFSSTLTGRHNGRSLSEFIVKRDGNLYILCEDVTSTGGGPWTVANAFGAVTNVNWQVMVYNPVTNTWNTSKINGTTPIQYGTNMGPLGVSPNMTVDFWFYNINASLHDVAPNALLIQGNWTAGAIQVLNTTSTPALTNANLTTVAGLASLFAGYGISTAPPYYTDPDTDPCSIIHNSDYANGAGDRTIFILNNSYYNIGGSGGNDPAGSFFYAPPSYNWATPTAALFRMPPNSYASGGPNNTITAFNQDHCSYQYIGNQSGATFDHLTWFFPTLVHDNYIHFVRGGAGGFDGLPTGAQTACSYGKSFGQVIAYLPTYWKWTGSAWVIADTWADAVASPYTVPAYAGGFSAAVPLPYGLQVQFGPTSAATYSQNEFHTFNVAVGNTKYTRKGRFAWAMFAGQTFLNAETRTIANENAMSINFVDTDVWATPTFTAPTSQTPNTAPLTNPAVNSSSNSAGWNTQVSWPKLDVAHAGYDATPLVMTMATTGFDETLWINPSAINPTGNESNGGTAPPPGVNPWSWTVGANTYVSTEFGRTPFSFNPSVWAWSGNPQLYWQGNTGTNGWTMLDLGVGNLQPCLSYGFRIGYDGSDNLNFSSGPQSFQLQGSNDGTFTDNAGNPFVVDDRTGGIGAQLSPPYKRGYGFNCNGPAAGTPFRYYRYYIFTSGGNPPSIGMIRMNSAVMTSSVNFTDFAFFAYGSQSTFAGHFYGFLRDWQWARGLKIEVSVNGGTSYTTIMEPGGTVAGGNAPLWRSHNGNVFSFPRQVGITNMRITVQHGYNYSSVSGFVAATTGFGPFYLLDYGTQAQLNASRLGTNGTQGTSTQVSYDYNSLGVATDVMSISIDSASPNLILPYSTLQDGAVFGFWDFAGVLAGVYKVHPFFGFLLLPGSGPDASAGTQAGTNAALQYQWGRKA